ncbi:MAG: ATP-binding cassette domain-containing protein [Olsenella sp.]|jgi:osmoprotectant transport system ATP-binding protein|nr:ATP-binding cassette domain-containing protein [Olsenella sp.]
MRESTDIAIEYRHVTKAYGEKVVLSDFNLSVRRREFLTIVGSSGCGKTTALKMVNRLIEPTSGDVLVNGTNVRDVDPIALRRNIGYAIQGSVLFPHMTVEENVSYVPNLLNKGDQRHTEQAVSKWMGIVDLPDDLLERYPAELSGGQQQRVGIARAPCRRRPTSFSWTSPLAPWTRSPADSCRWRLPAFTVSAASPCSL